MCGIVAIYGYGAGAPPVAQSELLAIREAMAVRGPDGEGLWLAEDGRVGLAHRRLAIIDLSEAAAQPMAGGALRIVYNGEIYNYGALKTELEHEGHRFRTESDTEVLLQLYEREGPKMVHRLRGMYAFAIWDGRRRGLFLARDPLGIKLLYYADDGQCLRVASQVKALKAGGICGREPEPSGHVGFFLWGHVPEPFTLYRDIRALPAGHTMWIDGTGPAAPRAFHSVRDVLAQAEAKPRNVTPEEMRERLRATLLDSVRHHFVADVPVGVFLSAGLDSTTLTALAAEAQAPPLRTLTLAFDELRGMPADEAPLAEAVAAQCGTEHVTRRVRGADFQGERERLLFAMDQPTIDGVNVYFVAKEAAEAGLKVALSGLGGDELFGGYPSFRQIPRLVRALAPLRGLPWLRRGFRLVSGPVLRRLTSPKYAGLLEYGTSIGDAYLLRRGLFMPWELPHILDPDLAREGWERLQPLIQLERTVAGLTGDHARVAALEMVWYMRNQLLRDADWAGMAHSLEIRMPLVDATLLSDLAPLLACGRPPRKSDMAATLRRPLPQAVLARAKTGFVVPVREWLQHADAGEIAGNRERGLRRWARTVYRAQTAI